MQALNLYARKHFFWIERIASFVGFNGLGYLLLHNLRCGLYVAILLVYLMAITKVYLQYVAQEKPLLPRGRSAAYVIAWWALALPIVLLAVSMPILMIAMIVLCYR